MKSAAPSLLAYAQLVRLPNVFTAFADIGLGWVVALGLDGAAPWPIHVALLAASGCLYLAGMVWNDFCDVEQDRRERPFRPIPSGRVRRTMAGLLAAVLMLVGIGFAWLAGWREDGWDARPGVLAGVLAALIVFYDAVAKRFWLGPLAMGGCRFLNILLGLSVAHGYAIPEPLRWHLAAAVGTYIVGVTWFAKTEAQVSNRGALGLAAGVMLTGLVLALLVPVWLKPGTSGVTFPYLLVGFGFWVGLPVAKAIGNPHPKQVQTAVKTAVLGLIGLDAILTTAFVGWPGLLLLALLIPATFLGRWVYST